MTHLSILTLLAASLVATPGWASGGSGADRGRPPARMGAGARHALRLEPPRRGVRLWAGPDNPVVFHDVRPNWPASEVAERDRVRA